MDVQGISLSITFSLHCGRAGCTFFVNAGLLDRLASNQSGTGMNKNIDAGTSQVLG